MLLNQLKLVTAENSTTTDLVYNIARLYAITEFAKQTLSTLTALCLRRLGGQGTHGPGVGLKMYESEPH